MKVLVAAIGKAKPGPEQQLYQDYIKRLPWGIACRELESRPAEPVLRKQQEASALRAACVGYHRLIALDERGVLLSSEEFSRQLGQWQQQGFSSFAFIIGGSDGLATELVERSDLAWSFGRVTWPHMLVRALLAEQLYRAHTLLSGHPYHRG